MEHKVTHPRLRVYNNPGEYTGAAFFSAALGPVGYSFHVIIIAAVEAPPRFNPCRVVRIFLLCRICSETPNAEAENPLNAKP